MGEEIGQLNIGKTSTVKKKFFGVFGFFFREFRHNRHYFRQFDQNCFFCRKIIFHLTQVPSRCDESSHHFFNINVGEMTNWSILAIFDKFERSYLLGQKALAENFWHVGIPQQLCFTQKI